VRRTTRAGPGFPPTALERAAREASEEILFEPLRDRRPRSNPRVVKRKMSGLALKRSRHRDWPQPTREPQKAVEVILSPAA